MPEHRQWIMQLGVLWGDAPTKDGIVQLIADEKTGSELFQMALDMASRFQSQALSEALLQRFSQEPKGQRSPELIRAMREQEDERMAEAMIASWSSLRGPSRLEAINLLVSRNAWTSRLVGAIAEGKVAASDLPASVIRSLVQHRDESLQRAAQAGIGQFRAPNADMDRLIASKREVVLNGRWTLSEVGSWQKPRV
jgi:hypothetical protein